MRNESAWAKIGWTDGAEQTKGSPSIFREVISCQGKQWCGIKVGFSSVINERLHRKGFGGNERKILFEHARAAVQSWIWMPRWGQLFSDLLELSLRTSQCRVASANTSRSRIPAEGRGCGGSAPTASAFTGFTPPNTEPRGCVFHAAVSRVHLSAAS